MFKICLGLTILEITPLQEVTRTKLPKSTTPAGQLIEFLLQPQHPIYLYSNGRERWTGTKRNPDSALVTSRSFFPAQTLSSTGMCGWQTLLRWSIQINAYQINHTSSKNSKKYNARNAGVQRRKISFQKEMAAQYSSVTHSQLGQFTFASFLVFPSNRKLIKYQTKES